jgi:hypothetical protein
MMTGGLGVTVVVVAPLLFAACKFPMPPDVAGDAAPDGGRQIDAPPSTFTVGGSMDGL